ncbi:hypothetical protein SODG_002022 [Sodalis praecaptivus]
MFFIKTKGNSRTISGRIKKAGQRRAIEFLKDANARLHFINIKTVHFINQCAIAFVLLPGGFGLLPNCQAMRLPLRMAMIPPNNQLRSLAEKIAVLRIRLAALVIVSTEAVK